MAISIFSISLLVMNYLFFRRRRENLGAKKRKGHAKVKKLFHRSVHRFCLYFVHLVFSDMMPPFVVVIPVGRKYEFSAVVLYSFL